jgi:hypothetical protein
MSRVTNDLRCENGHLTEYVLYRRADGPPCCPECGASTKAVPGRTPPALIGFGSVNYNGRNVSTGEMRQIKADFERANPGKKMVISSQSDSDIDARIDARKQRIADRRKILGIDAKTMAEKQIEDDRKKIEALDRGKVATADVHRDIAKVEQHVQRVNNYTEQNR